MGFLTAFRQYFLNPSNSSTLDRADFCEVRIANWNAREDGKGAGGPPLFARLRLEERQGGAPPLFLFCNARCTPRADAGLRTANTKRIQAGRILFHDRYFS